MSLASVPPPISGARERLRDVLNSWVEQRADGEYLVSGLLTYLGRDNLSDQIRSACHVALAESIVSRGVMNQHSAFLAIMHFHHGGEFSKAGMILIMILKEAFKHNTVQWKIGKIAASPYQTVSPLMVT